MAVRLKTPWISGYQKSAMRRLWSGIEDTHVNLRIRRAHMQSCREWYAPGHVESFLVVLSRHSETILDYFGCHHTDNKKIVTFEKQIMSAWILFKIRSEKRDPLDAKHMK